jgi:hypothetical protein
MTVAVCFHLHCYQPPRTNPWLEVIEPELDAFPYHDWNERVTAECYRPNTMAAVLAPDQRLKTSYDNFATTSFDVVGTLHAWLKDHAPDVDGAVRAAARNSDGVPSGAALAAPAIHVILPLAAPEDRDVLVAWGVTDFAARFGFLPTGMWLPETGVDLDTLDSLHRHGISFTVLMPQQARRVRAPGGEWVDVSGELIDPTRPYSVALPGGGSMTVVFGHGPLSRGVAFGGLLDDGASFVDAVRATVVPERADELILPDELILIVTDGETFGHHHEFGEMALAWTARELRANDIEVTNLGEWLERHPATWEVELYSPSSWSCAHGVERWRSDCGCTTSSRPGWNQSWRAPLRRALDWLRASLAPPVEAALAPLLKDPQAALCDYGAVLAGQEEPAEFVARRAERACSDAETTLVLALLEARRHLLSAFTSCAWFFADPTGIETLLSLRHAAVVLDTASEVLGLDAESGFLARLEEVRSNLDPKLSGRELWARFVAPHRIDATAIAGAFALELAAGAADCEARRGAWSLRAKDLEVGEEGVLGTVVVEHMPTLRRSLVEVKGARKGAVGALAHGRLVGTDRWREIQLSGAGADVIARVGAARLGGSASTDPLGALRLLIAGLRKRAAEADDAAVFGAFVSAAAPLSSRDLDVVRGGLAVLRDASVSDEAAAALARLSFLAKVTSVEWPFGLEECESEPVTH